MADDNSFSSTSGSDVASTIVGGLFNIGSGFLNNYFGKKASKKEYQRALDLWNIQNEYNKPVNQMARLREAGLNPNLVAGSLSNSVAGAVHAPSKENLSSPLEGLDLVGSYQNIRQKDAMTQQIDAQTKQIKQQTKIAKQAGIHTKLENTLLGLEIGEHLNRGTSRVTPIVERNYRSLTRIGEDVGARLYDFTHGNVSNSIADENKRIVKGFWKNTPYYKGYEWLRSKF